MLCFEGLVFFCKVGWCSSFFCNFLLKVLPPWFLLASFMVFELEIVYKGMVSTFSLVDKHFNRIALNVSLWASLLKWSSSVFERASVPPYQCILAVFDHCGRTSWQLLGDSSMHGTLFSFSLSPHVLLARFQCSGLFPHLRNFALATVFRAFVLLLRMPCSFRNFYWIFLYQWTWYQCQIIQACIAFNILRTAGFAVADRRWCSSTFLAHAAWRISFIFLPKEEIDFRSCVCHYNKLMKPVKARLAHNGGQSR